MKNARKTIRCTLLYFLFRVSRSNDFFELFFDIKRPLSNLIGNSRDCILYPIQEYFCKWHVPKRFLETCLLDIAPFFDHVTNVRILTHVTALLRYPLEIKAFVDLYRRLYDIFARRNSRESFMPLPKISQSGRDNRRSIVRDNTIRTMRHVHNPVCVLRYGTTTTAMYGRRLLRFFNEERDVARWWRRAITCRKRDV